MATAPFVPDGDFLRDMVVRTDTPAVRRLQRTALELLLSVHHVDCGHCPANKKCELQKIARFLKVGLRPKRLEPFPERPGNRSPIIRSLNHHPNRCVLCGKCIQVCREAHGTPLQWIFPIGDLKRSSAFTGKKAPIPFPAMNAGAVLRICPVGALTLKTATDPMSSNPEKSKKVMSC